MQNYRNDPKFWDRQVWANSVDPNQTGLYCLLLIQYVLQNNKRCTKMSSCSHFRET